MKKILLIGALAVGLCLSSISAIATVSEDSEVSMVKPNLCGVCHRPIPDIKDESEVSFLLDVAISGTKPCPMEQYKRDCEITNAKSIEVAGSLWGGGWPPPPPVEEVALTKEEMKEIICGCTDRFIYTQNA